MKIITRILVLPVVALMILIFHVKEILVCLYYFLRYGGEFITYRKADQGKLINDVFEQLIEQKGRENNETH